MNKNTVKNLGEITINSDLKILPAVLRYAEQVAEIIGMTMQERNMLQLALEEVIVDVINNSFSTEDEGKIDISFRQHLDGIEIAVHDMGLPYDPKSSPAYDPKAGLDQSFEGLGAFLINQMVDSYQFSNLGTKGKEIILRKFISTKSVVEEAPDNVEAEVALPPEKKPVEQINFNIRLMKDSEAMEVCRCIYDCYGYSYANENIYYPERVVAMNEAGQLRSVVAVTDEGEIGGHFAIIYYDHLPAEAGIAVTKKKFRGQGFARQLGEELAEEAKKDGLKGMQIKEVTAHPYTQKFCSKLGYNDCGILLAHSPKSLSFKGIADKLKQRNSDILGFQYFQDPDPIKIYPPEHHKEMITKLFNNIGVEVECLPVPADTKPKNKKTTMSVIIHPMRSLAEMGVLEYGEDIAQVMREELRKVFRDEAEVVELYLSLDDPMTAEVVVELEKFGFFFTGVIPETSIGNCLIMQYLNGVHIDYDELVIVSEVAQELLEYIKKNDPDFE